MTSTFYIAVVPQTVCTGDEFTVLVLMDTPEAVNAVQGALQYNPAYIRATGVEHGTSFATYWVVPPSLSGTPGIIPFVGGVPTPGFVGSDGVVMSVVMKAEQHGELMLSLAPDTIALLNDGNATEATVLLTGNTVTIRDRAETACVGRAPLMIASTDTTPPLPFMIEITRTENAFSGDYFASFHTTDAQSGVAYYEVMETSTFHATAWHRADSPYRLATQAGDVQLGVRAIDNAGNMRTETASTSLQVTDVRQGAGDLALLMIAGALAILILWHCWTQRDREE